MLDIFRDDWITARLSDGNLVQTGVRGCFEKAEQIQEIFIDGVTTAMDNASVFSLLEVFLCRVMRIQSEEEKYELFQNGRFDENVMRQIDQYVADCEKRGISFDVFDKDHPFLQNAEIPVKTNPSAVSVLDAVMLSGNNSIFHAGALMGGKKMEDQYEMTKQQYAASVIRNCQFRIASGAGYSPSGLCTGQPPLYLILEGKNLFETLVMSLYCYNSREKAQKDLPLWEQPEIPVDVPKLIADNALGYCASMFLPTVGLHYGKFDGERVSTVYVWKTTELYSRFGNNGKIHYPSDPDNMDVVLNQTTNFLVYDIKKDKKKDSESHKAVCTYSASRDLLLDLFRLDEENAKGIFRRFGYNSLEAVRFLDFLDSNDCDLPERIPCRIYGLRMLKKGEPQPAQLIMNMDLPERVITSEDAYFECSDLVGKLHSMVQQLNYTLYRLDMDMTYERDRKDEDKVKTMDADHVRELISQKVYQYSEYVHNRCTGEWLKKTANEGDRKKAKMECLEEAYQEALHIYDQYPVTDRNYIRQIQWKGMLINKLKEVMKDE